MIGFVSFVVMFSLLIFAHEFGHFAVAKLCGVHVEEFGFGYPPRMLKLGTWRGTAISLNWLPVGGFVRMSEDDPTVPGSLASKGPTTRALVYVAGALMNVLLAVVLYSVTFTIGTLVPVQAPGAGIYVVSSNSPAEQAGFRPGDTIISMNGETVRDVQQAVELIHANAGKPVEIVLRRNDQLLPPATVTPRLSPPPGEGALGVSLDLPFARQAYPVWQAVPMGAQATVNGVRAIFLGIRAIVRKQIPLEVSGPVGIYRATAEVAKTGLSQLLEFTAFLSLNLFLINLLPLPALDGGRLIFVLLEWVRGGRKVPAKQEGLVHFVGMVVILSLMAVVTFFDIVHWLT
jgi:regulator of sigma E protease